MQFTPESSKWLVSVSCFLSVFDICGLNFAAILTWYKTSKTACGYKTSPSTSDKATSTRKRLSLHSCTLIFQHSFMNYIMPSNIHWAHLPCGWWAESSWKWPRPPWWKSFIIGWKWLVGWPVTLKSQTCDLKRALTDFKVHDWWVNLDFKTYDSQIDSIPQSLRFVTRLRLQILWLNRSDSSQSWPSLSSCVRKRADSSFLWNTTSWCCIRNSS